MHQYSERYYRAKREFCHDFFLKLLPNFALLSQGNISALIRVIGGCRKADQLLKNDIVAPFTPSALLGLKLIHPTHTFPDVSIKPATLYKQSLMHTNTDTKGADSKYEVLEDHCTECTDCAVAQFAICHSSPFVRYI